MSTETALLRAIRDMPDEDMPRLVYADFLEEDGYSPRAEFIRLQVERARLPEHDPRREQLLDREHELLGEHECSWLGVGPDDAVELGEWDFERGFIHEVAAAPAFMNGPGTDLCAAHPVCRWRVQTSQTDLPEDLREAGQRGWCSRLEALDLADYSSDLGPLSGFLGSRSTFSLLRELDLTHREPLGSLPEIIECAPFRDQLTILRCGLVGYEGGRLDVADFLRALGTNCKLGEFAAPGSLMMTDDVRDLLAAGAMASLTSLDLHANQIAPEAWEAFRGARFRLRKLDLSGTALGAFALDRLLGCASLTDLRNLHVNQCASTAANIRALSESRFWTQAEELRIAQGTVWNEAMEYGEAPQEAIAPSLDPLFNAKGPSNLRVLDIGGNGVRVAGVAKLCAAAWAGSLAYLDLSQNYLTDEALREIARSGRFKNLRTLHLNFNSVYHQNGAEPDESITDAGLRALADCPELANLRILSVSGTRITSEGVDAVLNGPHWRLTGLQLAHCQLRPNVIEVLASSPRLARLEMLDLSENNDIDIDDLEPLAESEYLSPQTELDIRGIHGTGKIRTALRQRLGCRLSE